MAIKWAVNLLCVPFKRARQVSTKDLGILAFAGLAFMITGFLSLNVKWAPPLDANAIYISLATGAIGLVMLIISFAGFIK
jgi:hypothetical protein